MHLARTGLPGRWQLRAGSREREVLDQAMKPGTTEVARGDARRRVIDRGPLRPLPPILRRLKALECLAHRRQTHFVSRSVPAKAARNCAAEPNFGGTIVMSPSDNHLLISLGNHLAGRPRPELLKVECRPCTASSNGQNLCRKSFFVLFRGSSSKSSGKLLHVRFDLLFAKVECPTALPFRSRSSEFK